MNILRECNQYTHKHIDPESDQNENSTFSFCLHLDQISSYCSHWIYLNYSNSNFFLHLRTRKIKQSLSISLISLFHNVLIIFCAISFYAQTGRWCEWSRMNHIWRLRFKNNFYFNLNYREFQATTMFFCFIYRDSSK